jgi:4-amino-4-deoxy-L-arabinose transferase-like glycosyltransferase
VFRISGDVTTRRRLALAIIVLLALGLRLWRLDVLPPGLWYDEALYCLNALSIGHGSWPIFFMLDDHPVEPLYVYSLAAAFALAGPHVLAARVVSALWGTLAVALFYPVARRLFSARWALLGCLLYAVFRWPLHFSRTIFRASTPPVFVLLVVLFFMRWREQRRTRDAALCGLFLGLGLYTYIAFRLVPILFVVWVLWLAWRGEIIWRRDARPLAVIAATAFLVFVPLGVHFLRHPGDFTERLDEVSMFSRRVTLTQPDGTAVERVVRKPLVEIAEGLAGNTRAVALAWFVRGDHVARHNLPLEPVFDWLSGAVFLLGGVRSLCRCARREVAFLPLAWIIVISAASIFSFGAPNILRMQAAIPAAVLLYMAGLQAVDDFVRRRASRPWRFVVIGALVLWFAGYQLDSYFRRFAQSPAVRNEFLTDSFFEPARAARQLASDMREVWVSRDLRDHLTFRFVTHGVSNIHALDDLTSLTSVAVRPAALLASAMFLSGEASRGVPVEDILQRLDARLLKEFRVAVFVPERAAWTQAPWAYLWALPARPTTQEVPRR